MSAGVFGGESDGELIPMRLWQALSAFCRVLFDRDFAARVRALGEDTSPAAPATPSKPRPAATESIAPRRNDAITLLATLQREARFVDIMMEPLGDYSDAQIGAATRDVLRDCRTTLERLFDLQPLVSGAEGTAHEMPAGADAACYRLLGNVAGQPPYQGQLVHHGWRATQCELPQWSGSEEATMVVAPVELELS